MIFWCVQRTKILIMANKTNCIPIFTIHLAHHLNHKLWEEKGALRVQVKPTYHLLVNFRKQMRGHSLRYSVHSIKFNKHLLKWNKRIKTLKCLWMANILFPLSNKNVNQGWGLRTHSTSPLQLSVGYFKSLL